MDLQNSSSNSLEIANVTGPKGLFGAGVFAGAPLIPEAAWCEYGTLRMQLYAAIPLQEVTLAYLEGLKVGNIVCSTWAASEDVPLCVDETFLANVCFEPAGTQLAVRISDFTPREGPNLTRGSLASSSSMERSERLRLLDILRVDTFLRFGAASLSLEDILRFTIGHTIILNRGVASLVEIMVKGHIVATGVLVLVKGLYAVQIVTVAHALCDLPLC